MAGPSMSDAQVAQATFELENDITTVQGVDAVFQFDANEQRSIQASKPWTKEYVYHYLCFNKTKAHCSISLAASHFLLEQSQTARTTPRMKNSASTIFRPLGCSSG